MIRSGILGLLAVLTSCIGKDYLNSPIQPEKLDLVPSSIALMVSESKSLSVIYQNKYGVIEKAKPSWFVSNPAILSITQDGEITGLQSGNAKVFAQQGTAIDSVHVTVVNSINQVAKVEIVAGSTSINIGSEIMFSGLVKSIQDVVLSKPIQWKSSNAAVVSIDATGKATANSYGSAIITGEVDGVVSNSVLIAVGAIRQGTFVKSGGYEASGNVTLQINGSKLELELGSNFKTSFALGTYIYLANSNSSGANIKASGLEIQQITKNGAHLFNVSSVNPAVKLSDFKYVIILCKPASVVFGYAELN